MRGTLGAAWTVAALIAIRDALGWDPRDADVLVGTSAGAELVTMLGSGIGVDEILAMQLGESTHPVLADTSPARPADSLHCRAHARVLPVSARALPT